MSPLTALTDEGTATLTGTYGMEPGPDGTGWRWLQPGATLAVRGPGRRWIAFRALANRTTRSLRLDPATGPARTIRVTPRNEAFVIGPVDIGDSTTFEIVVSGGPTQGNPGDERDLSVFLSPPIVADAPVVVIPGKGFFWPEQTAAGASFRWLGTRGLMDVHTDLPIDGDVIVSAKLVAGGGIDRSLTASAGGVSETVEVTGDSTSGEHRFGPFPLRDGRLRIRLRASPGAAPISDDTRRLAIQVADLEAQVASP